MLPLQQTYEVKHSILEYLKATFGFKDKSVQEAFYRFIADKKDGIFKGPYVSLKLPFVKLTAEQTIPLEIRPDFPPYDHQYKSFQRLHSHDQHEPQPTLITTGTSSGKTECFLYPILDYCFKNIHRNGIKVIILYPMNALATDQAKRIAEAIWKDDRLKGRITAGLFIGEGKDSVKYPKDMGGNHIIENRNSIVDSPPDILLTNFKMLDYALMRNNFNNLWTYNFEDSSLLKFLVLDELHTYDGAQGTDVANLIRRLKLKLHIPKGQICPIGTSATMGSGEESKQLLTSYATKVFGESFDADAVITENRVTVSDFFDIAENQLDRYIPRHIGLLESRLKENETYDEYILRQKRLWQVPETVNAVQLGDELKKLKLVRDLVSLSDKHITTLDDLLRETANINEEFRRLPEWDDVNQMNPQEEVVNSILALISHAKTGANGKSPFLYVQIQIWVRELSGLLRKLNETPSFLWKDNAGTKYEEKSLPAYHCRECGSSGWLGVKDDNKNHFYDDANQVYEYFFNNHKNIYFINTASHKHIEEYEPTNTIDGYLHPVEMTIKDKDSADVFKIHAVRKLNESKARHICPECNSENTIGIIGTRLATLSSISVSQVLSSDLDPRDDKYRKILAFTNSVQDAAHQAGFVEARNYRFTFRSSLQKVVNLKGNAVNLKELEEDFIKYWKEHADESNKNDEDAYYYRFFPADYKGKVDIDHDYRIGKKFTADFKKEFDERMRWEIVSEYGFNADIGRTLEKTGTSAVRFDDVKLNAIFPLMQNWLSENGLISITEDLFTPFVNGILHRIRIRGGLDHIFLDKFRTGELKIRELNWERDTRHFLNKNFGSRSRIPKLITTAQHQRGVLDSTYTQSNNWFRSYYLKSFQMATAYPAIVNDFYQKLFDVLSITGIMNKKGTDGNENYAIIPEVLIIENKIKCYSCDTCGSVLHVASHDTLTDGAKCLDYTCKSGAYQLSPIERPSYYQLIYNRSRAPRIYAAEHTGILGRKDREEKEKDFKERPKFNSLNAIVATSTLEMGIDIGTLNSVINNSVPPLTSNFLQRVGRAGRSTGSALVTNFAKSQPHDLFYYEEPLDMMEGSVSTPGCYLEAKEILFRHFFAYCLDNWAVSDDKNNFIPGRLISLRLLNTDLSTPEFLSNRIISFIKAREEQLLTRFSEFYKPDLTDVKVLEALRLFLADESFYLRIRNTFIKLKSEYTYIFQKRKEIQDIIKTNNLAESDEERKILEAEFKALWGLKRMIDKRSVLEHMTNIGLLPNYAFPETGVTLNAWVKSAQAKASNSLPGDKQYELVRASNVALREFAPGNYFYSQGNKFEISGLNTYDWKDPGILLQKRFCSNCDHLAESAGNAENSCPKCGDTSWASVKNQHTFVKISGVKSVTTREKSTLDDSSDERDLIQYKISRHIKFDKDSFQGAWGMKDIPFGIEYIKNVDIIEINLGLTSSVDANKISINQIENVPYHGFVTCKYCGKSTSEPHRVHGIKGLSFHYGFCKYKDIEYPSATEKIFEEVYLFREMKTEALKVLLPVQEFEGEAQINMFKAGMELGLKKYYQGNPQHLNIIDYTEFNLQTSKFDKYLVIHDNIPGGTGYLEKLFNPAEFMKVMNLAYEAIKECLCQFKEKDGCYRCIYTYANQRTQSELSRSKAEQIFKKIVEKSTGWENYATGLGALSDTGQIEESELEDRFVRSLKNHLEDRKHDGYAFESIMQDGTIHYRIKVTNQAYVFYYVIRPQYELGPSQGVRYSTRSDFYISLTSIQKDGQDLNDATLLSQVKDIAIYMDGYQYHAQADNLRFYNDLQKRLAIAETNKILTWTLTWSDLEKFDDKNIEAKGDDVYVEHNKYAATIRIFKGTPHADSVDNALIKCKNSFERFIWLLCNPLELHKYNKKLGLVLALKQNVFGKNKVSHIGMDELIYKNRLSSTEIVASDVASGAFYMLPDINDEDFDFVSMQLGVRMNDLHVRSSLSLKPFTESLDKSHWEKFWQFFNLMQSECHIIDESNDFIEEAPTDIKQEKNDYECLKYYDTDLHFIIQSLIDHEVPFGKDGSFFVENDGKVAEAQIGFHDLKIFIRPISDEDRSVFIAEGYTEMLPNDFDIKNLKNKEI